LFDNVQTKRNLT